MSFPKKWIISKKVISIFRIQGAKGSRIQLKGAYKIMGKQTLEPLNP
jgi:hypothetical protein